MAIITSPPANNRSLRFVGWLPPRMPAWSAGPPSTCSAARVWCGASVMRMRMRRRPLFQVVSSVKATPPISIGNQPPSAILAAVGIQRALDAEVFAPDVRIGAHTGDAFETDADSDFAGEGVHAAARIGALAKPGEILVSRDTLDGVAGGLRLSEPRSEVLKGFEEPVDVVSVDWR